MDGNLNQLAQELRSHPALVQSAMRSKDGQTLLRMLDSQGDGFQRAVQSAAQGDSAEMVRRLERLTRSPEGAAILERLYHAVRM